MLVALTGLGSIWSCRPGRNASSPERFGREAAYFNTTGVLLDGKLRRRSRIYGEVRFNGSADFDPHHPASVLQRVYQCSDLCVWNGATRLLCGRRVHASPEQFLVAVTDRELGRVTGMEHWRSDDSVVISRSECAAAQEILLLMRPYGWVRTDRGLFMLHIDDRCRARLVAERP
jgi:hypothetical protein